MNNGINKYYLLKYHKNEPSGNIMFLTQRLILETLRVEWRNSILRLVFLLEQWNKNKSPESKSNPQPSRLRLKK